MVLHLSKIKNIFFLEYINIKIFLKAWSQIQACHQITILIMTLLWIRSHLISICLLSVLTVFYLHRNVLRLVFWTKHITETLKNICVYLRENVQRCSILYIYLWVTDIIQAGNPTRSPKISYFHLILTGELALLSFIFLSVI